MYLFTDKEITLDDINSKGELRDSFAYSKVFKKYLGELHDKGEITGDEYITFSSITPEDISNPEGEVTYNLYYRIEYLGYNIYDCNLEHKIKLPTVEQLRAKVKQEREKVLDILGLGCTKVFVVSNKIVKLTYLNKDKVIETYNTPKQILIDSIKELGYKVLCMRGEQYENSHVCAEILEEIDNASFINIDTLYIYNGAWESIDLLVSSFSVAKVIGRGGSKVKEISKLVGKKVNISDEDNYKKNSTTTTNTKW